MRFITAGDNQLLVQSNLKALNSIRGKITTSIDPIQAAYKNTVQRM